MNKQGGGGKQKPLFSYKKWRVIRIFTASESKFFGTVNKALTARSKPTLFSSKSPADDCRKPYFHFLFGCNKIFLI
jgi:hypothetical protein